MSGLPALAVPAMDILADLVMFPFSESQYAEVSCFIMAMRGAMRVAAKNKGNPAFGMDSDEIQWLSQEAHQAIKCALHLDARPSTTVDEQG